MGHEKKCRCEACLTKRRRQAKLRLMGKAGRVPIGQVADFLDDLHRKGHTNYEIAEAARLDNSKVSKYRHRRQDSISVAVAHRILTADYSKRLPSTLVPAEPAVRRLRALVAIGWRLDVIADMLELPHSTIGSVAGGKAKKVRYETASAIADLYERFSGTPGPCDYSRIRSAKRGWLPPLAWDDIDNPKERPNVKRVAG